LIGGDDDDERAPYYSGNFGNVKINNKKNKGPLKLQK